MAVPLRLCWPLTLLPIAIRESPFNRIAVKYLASVFAIGAPRRRPIKTIMDFKIIGKG